MVVIRGISDVMVVIKRYQWCYGGNSLRTYGYNLCVVIKVVDVRVAIASKEKRVSGVGILVIVMIVSGQLKIFLW